MNNLFSLQRICVGATPCGCPLSGPDSGQAQGPAPTYMLLRPKMMNHCEYACVCLEYTVQPTFRIGSK